MLRFILGEILSGVPSSFDNIQRIVPEIGLQLNAYPILPGNGRLIKTHEPYCRAYKRAIYLIRDVRDAMLSFFARETAVGAIHPSHSNLDDYVLPFMQGKLSHFGSWQSHVASWMNSPLAQSGDLLVVRFEDMREDTETWITRCLEFLGKQVDASVIQAAIRNNSLEKMRDKEQQSKRLAKISGDGRQINKGVIGRWRQTLTERQLRIVDQYAGDTLARFGYPSGINGQPAEQEHPEKTAQQRRNFVDTGILPVRNAGTGRSPQVSAVNLDDEAHPSANRALRIRMGGRIANFFSWYRY